MKAACGETNLMEKSENRHTNWGQGQIMGPRNVPSINQERVKEKEGTTPPKIRGRQKEGAKSGPKKTREAQGRSPSSS